MLRFRLRYLFFFLLFVLSLSLFIYFSLILFLLLLLALIRDFPFNILYFILWLLSIDHMYTYVYYMCRRSKRCCGEKKENDNLVNLLMVRLKCNDHPLYTHET